MSDFEFLYPQYPTENVFPFEPSTQPKKYKVSKNRPTRIYCDGIYDLFHYGHARSLQQAKNLFPNVFLIVGICNDTTTHKNKGKTVYTDKERYETVRHCRYVDMIVEDAPWIVTDEFIKLHNIDFIAHDDIPFLHNGTDVYDEFKKRGVFIPTKRTLGVSTSGLITRIVKDYDEFVWRNLERGVSAKELNVSIFDENMYKVKKRVKEVKKKAKDEIKDMREEIRVAMKFWEEMGKEFVKRFENENVWLKIKNVLRKKSTDNEKDDERGSTDSVAVKDSKDDKGNKNGTNVNNAEDNNKKVTIKKKFCDNKK